jgi:hypothetical protein
MKHLGLLLLMVGLAGGLIGCEELGLDNALSPGRGSTRTLGDVSYAHAYATGREVLAQYYPLDPVKTNVDTGTIQSRPKVLSGAGQDRLLSASAARHIATLRIFQENGLVSAQIVVEQQRQGSDARSQMGYSTERMSENYSGNPGELSPAEMEAATTLEQNQTWLHDKDRHDIEATILQDLYNALHGKRGN